MILDNNINVIILLLKEYLDTKKDILSCFSDQGVQLEGWFKGELLYFLSTLKKTGQLYDFDREVKSPVANKKIDFKLELQIGNKSEIIWLELKHWLIGYQKGYKYNAQFYFGDPTSIGIKPDIEKLAMIKSDNRYVLISMTENPGKDGWYNGIQKFNNKFSNLKIKNMNDPSEYEDFYFLGLIKVL
jgi:hypothetical protein